MVKIQKLVRPTRKSGHNLSRGKTFKVGGLTITNVSAPNNVYVDRFTRKKARKKK